MNINEVIESCILAIFSDKTLSETLVLKGGSALRILEKIDFRLSVDVDFSVKGSIKKRSSFFKKMEKVLSKKFNDHGYFIIDFEPTIRPNTRKPNFPKWWSGWLCQFKLVGKELKSSSLSTQRRNAMIPTGAHSSKISIDISEYEYCDSKQKKKIKGITVQGYTRSLLVLEKLRAICQQHPEYKFSSSKNRSRDFYDIYQLSQNFDDRFLKRCKTHLPLVFEAKKVPLKILSDLWNIDFIEPQEKGFRGVRDTVRGPIEDFSFYLENVRYLVLQIFPEVIKFRKIEE